MKYKVPLDYVTELVVAVAVAVAVALAARCCVSAVVVHFLCHLSADDSCTSQSYCTKNTAIIDPRLIELLYY